MADALKIAPTLTISYLSINLTRKPLDDVRIREALNLAIERETLVERIIKLGDPPAYNMVPSGTANYPGGVEMRFKAMPFEQRLARAQELMREAGYTPERPLKIGWATTTNVVTRQTVAPLQEMWRKIYVDVEIIQSDTQINYQKLEDGDFEIGTAGWIADYNDASNFLDVLRTGGGNNYGRYSNPKFDALLDQAASERDLAKRGTDTGASRTDDARRISTGVRALPDAACNRATLCERLDSEQQTDQPDPMVNGPEGVATIE